MSLLIITTSVCVALYLESARPALKAASIIVISLTCFTGGTEDVERNPQRQAREVWRLLTALMIRLPMNDSGIPGLSMAVR